MRALRKTKRSRPSSLLLISRAVLSSATVSFSIFFRTAILLRRRFFLFRLCALLEYRRPSSSCDRRRHNETDTSGFLKYGALATCSLCGVSRHIGGTNLLGEEIKPQFPLYEDGQFHRIDSQERTYHVSCSIDMFEINGDFPEIWRDVGITDAWLSVWFYGHFPYSWETLDYWLGRLKSAEIRPHLLCVPFCHGGGALDPRTEDFQIFRRNIGRSPNVGTAPKTGASPGILRQAPKAPKLLKSCTRITERLIIFSTMIFGFHRTRTDAGGCVCEECQRDFLNKSGLEAAVGRRPRRYTHEF